MKESLEKTLSALSSVHNLLSQGLFQGSAVLELKNAMLFIENLHTETMKQYDLIKDEITVSTQDESK